MRYAQILDLHRYQICRTSQTICELLCLETHQKQRMRADFLPQGYSHNEMESFSLVDVASRKRHQPSDSSRGELPQQGAF